MSKLQVKTEGQNEIVMVRTFDAPRRLVVRAMTEPELIKRWLGNSRSPVVSVESDLRVGGSYRYVFRRPDGVEFALAGEYREIAEDRIVQTQGMDGQPAALNTTTWVEEDGKTTMTIVMRFASQEIRDFVLNTGMADGAEESYGNLDALLAEGA